MTWLAAVQDVPGGGLEAPPGFLLRPLLLGIPLFVGWLIYKTGLLDPGHLRSPLPTHRLRRTAYRVVCEAFDMSPVGQASKDPATRRAYERAHQRQTIPTLKRDGSHAVYVVVRYKQGLDLGEGSKLRATFERRWRQAMTRPDEHGNAAHEWEFSWSVGRPVVLCRWVELPSSAASRLFEQLNPTIKWPEGTRAGEVVTAEGDGFAVTIPRGFRYDKAETRIGIQRHVNLTVESPGGAWQHNWQPTEDRYLLRAVPPLPDRARWEPDQLRPWTPAPDDGSPRPGPEPAIPVGVTHSGEIIWWEYEREGQLHAAAWGTTGSGKTGSSQSLVVAAYLSAAEKVVVLDPKAGPDWAWLAGYPRVDFAYTLDRMVKALADAERIRKARSEKQLKAIERQPRTGEPVPQFPPVFVYIDEASTLFTFEKARTDETKATNELRGMAATYTNNLAKMGRSANVHLIVVSQRPRADYFDSDTKFCLGFRIGLGDLDSVAARMIFDTSEAAKDQSLDDLKIDVVQQGKGYVGTGRGLAEVQMFYRSVADYIALLGPPPAPDPTPEPSEQVFGSQVEGIVVPSVKEPLTDWG